MAAIIGLLLVRSLEFDAQNHIDGLLFHGGSYAISVAQSQGRQAPPAESNQGFLDNYLLYLLRQTNTLYSQDFYPKLSALGVNTQEWRILTVISDLGSVRGSELASTVGQPPGELALTCDDLIARNLLTRSGEQYELTQPGVEICTQLVQMGSTHETAILKQLHDELQRTDSDPSNEHDESPIKRQLLALLKVLS